jgi:outer membrane immunogenic protein
MKRVLFAFATALLATQAFAADLPVPAPPPRAPAAYVPVVPVFTWTGFYIGANGGYAFGNTNNWSVTGSGAGGPPVGSATQNFNPTGFLAGGTVGANYQISWAVLGVEGDWDWDNIKGNAGAGCGTLGGTAAFTCQTSQTWLATGRARAGVGIDRVLVYLTGGVAYGNIQATPTPGFTDTTNKVGWTAGGGAEFALTPNITVKAEYLYVDLQNGSCTAACTTSTAGAITSANVTFKENLVRGGFNFKF